MEKHSKPNPKIKYVQIIGRVSRIEKPKNDLELIGLEKN